MPLLFTLAAVSSTSLPISSDILGRVADVSGGILRSVLIILDGHGIIVGRHVAGPDQQKRREKQDSHGLSPSFDDQRRERRFGSGSIGPASTASIAVQAATFCRSASGSTLSSVSSGVWWTSK